MLALEALKPFHVTTIRNLINILSWGYLYSKSILLSKKIRFDDPGELEDKRKPLIRVYKIEKHGDNFQVTSEFKELQLNEFVRLYLFVVKDARGEIFIPKFLHILSNNFVAIAILIFDEIIKVIEWARENNLDYYVILGHPYSKYPTAFTNLESLINYLYLDTPGIDALKEWLKFALNLIEDSQLPKDYFVGMRSHEAKQLDYYLNQLLASELIVRNCLTVNLLKKIIVVSDKYPKRSIERIRKLLRPYRGKVELIFQPKLSVLGHNPYVELYRSVWYS